MAVTRIQNNQITDSTITAAKIAPYTLTGGLFANSLTLNSNINVVGNLQVTGETTTVSSVNTYVNDPLILFNNGYVGSPAYDIGMVVNRNLQSLPGYGNYNTAWVWSETEGAFVAVVTTETGSTVGSINKAFYANAKVGNLTVTSAASFGTASFTNLTTSGTIISSGNIVAASGTASTNTTTGALVVVGGAGVSGALNVGGVAKLAGNVVISSTTDTTDLTTGALMVAGGVSITKKVMIGSGANTTRFANTTAVVSNVTGGTQQNEPLHNIGFLSEAVGNSNGSSFGVGLYGVGYTNLAAQGRGVTGEGHVSASTDTGHAVGLLGYATDTHSGGNNIGVYAIATGGANNYALWMNGGNILSGTAQTWTLLDNTATALSIDATGKTGILVVKTTDNAEGVTMSGTLGVTGNATLSSSLAVTNKITTNEIVTASLQSTSIGNVTPGTGYFTNLSATTGFGTANAVITGGSINNTPIGDVTPSTGAFTYLTATTGFSTANAVISGGYISSLTNATITTANVTTLTVTGQTTLANVTTANISAGNVTAYSLTTSGGAGSGNISGVNNLSATSINTGSLTATGDISANNVSVTNNLSALTGVITNFSSGNAVITGGYLNSLANVYATTGRFTNFSTANIVATGGNLQSLSNVATDQLWSFDAYLGNLTVFGLSTLAYTVINGGYLNNMTNVYATTSAITNFSTSNALITGGSITGLTNLGATTFVATNFSSGNAVISGGYINNTPIGNATPSTGAFTTLSASNWANVTGTTESTSSTTGTIVTAGGLGVAKNLNVGGNAIITGNLTVNGTVEYVNSIVTVHQDPILELNTGINGTGLTGGTNDSGIRTHYYAGGDNSAFFGRVNDTGYFEYYTLVNGESANTVTGTYGTIKSGALLLSNSTSSTSTSSGALQVSGGAGILGNLYVGGAIFQAGGALATFAAINGTPIGNLTPSTGAFTYLTATTGFSTANAVITGGYLNGLTNVYATTGVTTNFSTANAVITGGYITGMANIASTDVSGSYVTATTGLSTANAQITGGTITGLTNLGATTLVATNFSTANAVITGGYIQGVANVYTTTGVITNFSTANAVITGGYINSVANIYATTGNITNFSTANAVITGGYLNSMTNVYATTGNITNFSTANVWGTSGRFSTLDVTANLYVVPQAGVATVTINPLNIGFIDNMNVGASYQANVYSTNTKATTSVMENVTGTVVIKAGVATGSSINNIVIGSTNPQNGTFTNLTSDTLTANGQATLGNVTTNNITANLITTNVVITGGFVTTLTNIFATTATFTNFATGNAVITGGYINNTPIGNATPSTGAFTTLSATGATTLANATLSGGLQVPAIGNVTPGSGAFTTLTTTGNVKAGGNLMVLAGNTTNYTAATATALTNGAIIATGTGGLAVGGNAHIGGGAVINGSQTTYDTYIRGVNDSTLLLAIADSAYDQVVVGGSISPSSATQGAKLVINSTDALLIPVGTQGQRPSNAGFTDVAGMVRFNSTSAQLEIYDGTQWTSTGSSYTIIADEQFSGTSGYPNGNVDGVNTTFTISHPTTTAAAIVTLNGVVQLPALAYSITGANNDQLVFTEAPAPGDIIDVRTLTTTATVDQLASENGYNSIVMTTSNISVFTGSVSTARRWIWDNNGNYIPVDATVDIGSLSNPVDYLYANNISLTGGTLTGVSLAGAAIDNTPVGANIQSTGAFTTLHATTYANVEMLQVNTSAKITSIVANDGTGYTVYENTTGTIASFDKTLYRSAKYLIQLSTVDGAWFQTADLMIVHNDTTPTIETYGVTSTSGNTMATFTANIVAGTVYINATTATWANVTAKAIPTFITV